MIDAITRRSRPLGIFFLQLFKRSPFNWRPLFGIAPDYNAKAMGLFLEAYTRLFTVTGDVNDIKQAEFFAQWLSNNAEPGYSGACWGYNFSWANRRFYAPRGTPNVVTTAFIGHALLEFYRATNAQQWLDLAASACKFICHDLNRLEGGKFFSFSYTPLDRSCVHNANMLAASLLAGVAEAAGDSAFAELAERSMRYSLARQQPDGSWFYGEQWYDRWIDSFHSGYSLVALKRFMDARKDGLGDEALRRGVRFYRRNFFGDDGIVKYYHNKTHPLESHAFAHALIALQELRDLIEDGTTLSAGVFDRCLDLFWHPAGFFYYRRSRYYTIKIPYTRWVQAWMFLALIMLYQNLHEK